MALGAVAAIVMLGAAPAQAQDFFSALFGGMAWSWPGYLAAFRQ